MKLLPTSAFVTISLLALGGCTDELTDPVNPPSGMRPGVLEFYGDSVHATIPSTAAAGSAAVIRVLTWGDGCLRMGQTDVSITGRRVVIRPYDLIPDPATVCNMILLAVEHEAEVQLSEAGTWDIAIHGTRMPGDERIVARRYISVRD
jgi:hypothetical protein